MKKKYVYMYDTYDIPNKITQAQAQTSSDLALKAFNLPSRIILKFAWIYI